MRGGPRPEPRAAALPGRLSVGLESKARSGEAGWDKGLGLRGQSDLGPSPTAPCPGPARGGFWVSSTGIEARVEMPGGGCVDSAVSPPVSRPGLCDLPPDTPSPLPSHSHPTPQAGLLSGLGVGKGGTKSEGKGGPRGPGLSLSPSPHRLFQGSQAARKEWGLPGSNTPSSSYTPSSGL